MYFTTPIYHASQLIHRPVIIAALLKAAGALPGIDQRNLAELSGLSSLTIQRMEASEAMIRGNVDSLMKLITVLDAAGIESIAEGVASEAGGPGAPPSSESHRGKVHWGRESEKVVLRQRLDQLQRCFAMSTEVSRDRFGFARVASRLSLGP